MAPIHGHEDVPGDGNNGNNVTVLQNDHCNRCDTTLNDNRSVNHLLKRHQKLSIGNLGEERLNRSIPSTEPFIEIRFAYDTFKCDYFEVDTSYYEYSEITKTEYEVGLFPIGKVGCVKKTKRCHIMTALPSGVLSRYTLPKKILLLTIGSKSTLPKAI